ncbi:hypothetical protein [Hyphomonas sp.]|uniref:hypothetical protein n=1 Tax=Hyphomonas sp. TaxID=87 RepID=UPI00260D2C00|nr:hypothetical protein [Hyphomonas sp.]MDF1805798.1 hypothetical protein [Hyphomonas sp.]
MKQDSFHDEMMAAAENQIWWDQHRNYSDPRAKPHRLSDPVFGLIQNAATFAIMVIFVIAGFYVWEHESGHQLSRFWGAWLLFGGIPSLFVLGFKGIVHLNQKQATRNAEA